MANKTTRTIAIAAVTVLALADAGFAAPLTFNGVDAGATIAAIRARFPMAELDRLPCRTGQITARFVDGVARCEFLRVPSYSLAGYEFSIMFTFYESTGVKSASLRWPAESGRERLTSQEIRNAYAALLDLFVSRYGRYVTGNPCSYIGGRCQEWQFDGSSAWHAGGERIRIDHEPDASSPFAGVTISYRFADRRSFGRF